MPQAGGGWMISGEAMNTIEQRNIWGLLGPEDLFSQRRTRTLGLGAVVRRFNDLAVPGLGGVWFGKQLFLATLGVAVAEKVTALGKRFQNIEVANAIEALACVLAYETTGWQKDPRLRGRAKMQGKTDHLSFAAVRRPSFYVTQPMRRATVQPLPALELVKADGGRFNTFKVGLPENDSDANISTGMKFINAVCEHCRPHRSSVVDVLANWIAGSDKKMSTDEMREALSPLKEMPPRARQFLKERLVQNNPRRRNALTWVDEVRKDQDHDPSLAVQPNAIDGEHWRDLRAGTLFFAARAAALHLLDKIEEHLGEKTPKSMPLAHTDPIKQEMADLRSKAQAFLDSKYESDLEATAFCRECSDLSDAEVLKHLVRRDGQGLLLRSGESLVEGGPKFRGFKADVGNAEFNTEDEGAEADVETSQLFPEHMSPRVTNLYYLNLDLHGKLDDAIK